VVVELQWCRLREMEMEKGCDAWGVVIFGGEQGEGARQLHGAEGGRHGEEWRGGRGGRMRLLSEGRR
jgi:hypothetical protein